MRSSVLHTIVSVAISLLASSPLRAQPASPLQGVLTPIEAKQCRQVGQDVEFEEWSCPGVGDWRVHILTCDARDSLVLHHKKKKHSLAPFRNDCASGEFREILGPLEWRLLDGKPVGLLWRQRSPVGETGRKYTESFVIAKIDAARSCVVRVLPGRPEFLHEARTIADRATSLKCLLPPRDNWAVR